jgi:guanylate kinase
MPPCREDLAVRLKRRNTEAECDLERRLQTAGDEMEKLPFFDYAVVNADGQIEKVVDEIAAIITAEKLRTKPRHYQF